MARASKRKDIDALIDRGAERLEKLPETVLAERVQKIAASTGKWRVNRVNNSWVLIGENDHVDFEDASLGSVAFLLGMYADPNEKPEGIVKRYYGDLFEADSIN
jgi:hypothetical protein